MQQPANIDTCDLSHSPHCKFFQVSTDKNSLAGSRVPTSSTLLLQPCCCVVDVSCRVSCLADTAHKPPTGSQSHTHNLPPLPPCPLTQRWSDLASFKHTLVRVDGATRILVYCAVFLRVRTHPSRCNIERLFYLFCFYFHHYASAGERRIRDT